MKVLFFFGLAKIEILLPVVVQAIQIPNQIVQAENIKQLLMGKIKNNFNGKGI
jgi:hypothetical protein